MARGCTDARNIRTVTVLLFLVFLPSKELVARSKTDVIRLVNGDNITGEVIRLERGKLSLKTDSMGTVDIEWKDITSISSAYLFEIEDQRGTKYYGPIQSVPENRTVEVQTLMGPIQLNHSDVVRIGAIEERFLSRFDGSVDAGFAYTKANQDVQWNASASVLYRWRKTSVNINASSIVSTRKGTESTNRQSFNGSFRRSLAPRWFAIGVGGFQSNSELNLDLRATAGGGIGRNVIQSNNMLMSLSGGSVLTKEQYTTEATPEPSPREEGVRQESTNVEGFLAWTFQTFRFDSPKLDLTSYVTFLPNFTDLGRVRLDFDTKLRYEVFKDFFWSISLFDNFDSRPPDDQLEKNDFGITTGLGWSF